MLRAKTRILFNNSDQLKLANSRISQVISENRRNPASVMGNREWWKNIDLVSQCWAKTTCVNLDHDSLDHLNDYFGCLCSDDSFVRPTDVLIEGGVKVPEITERQVWSTLTKLKRTATGADNVPYWIWKDHAELLTPVITHLWNLSLSTHSWPGSRKRANINPCPRSIFPRRILTTE